MNSFTQKYSRRQRRQNERNIHTLDSPCPNYRYLPESDFESVYCSNIDNNNLPKPFCVRMHFRHSKKNITCISKLYQFLTSKNREKKLNY